GASPSRIFAPPPSQFTAASAPLLQQTVGRGIRHWALGGGHPGWQERLDFRQPSSFLAARKLIRSIPHRSSACKKPGRKQQSRLATGKPPAEWLLRFQAIRIESMATEQTPSPDKPPPKRGWITILGLTVLGSLAALAVLGPIIVGCLRRAHG